MENIYSGGPSLEERRFAAREARRHMLQTFPNTVSEWGIGDPGCKRIIDIGCGGSASLAAWVVENEGEYIGVDINPLLLKWHAGYFFRLMGRKEEQANLVRANVVSDEWVNKLQRRGIDMAHMRFVCEHVARHGGDGPLLKNAIDLCGGKGDLIVVEYDWEDFWGSDNVNDWVREASALLRQAGVDINYGGKVVSIVEEVLEEGGYSYSGSEEVFRREDCGDPDELFVVAESTEGLTVMLEQRGIEGMAEIRGRLGELRERMEEEDREAAGGGGRIIYTPPAIHAVRYGFLKI